MNSIVFNKTHSGYPFQKQRVGIPAFVIEKVGPFSLNIANKGFHEVYEVVVDGVTILSQASRPGLEDICRKMISLAGIDTGLPYGVVDDYMHKVTDFLQSQKKKRFQIKK